jgi:hypothetical protein
VEVAVSGRSFGPALGLAGVPAHPHARAEDGQDDGAEDLVLTPLLIGESPRLDGPCYSLHCVSLLSVVDAVEVARLGGVSVFSA